MERILSSLEMKKADEYTINDLGVPSEVLVQRAGEAVAKELINRFKGGRVLVCVGKGNNGADGKVVAEILAKTHGFSVAVLNVSNGIFKLFDKKFDIIVDCIFGIGLNREVEGKYKEAIEKINESGAYVVACDIASGLNADNGKVMGVSVKANLTIAIQEFKLGHFLNDGPDYSGEVISKDIGISIWGEDYAKKLNDSDLKKIFPKRNRNVNKGNFGKACVFGGSLTYPGSAILAYKALASLKMGVGYTHLLIPKNLYEICLSICPECVLNSVKDDGENLVFDKESIDKVLDCGAISFGMGAKVTEENYKIIKYILSNYKGKFIIDADGLNTISKYGIEVLKNKKCEVVLTPHVGEFARLVNKDKREVVENQIALAKEFASEYNVTLILKSSVSVITDGNEVFINTTGNSGMAKSGSGDVLSGLTAGLLARGVDTLDGAAASAYLFGLAGDFVKKEKNEYTMTASSIVNAFDKVVTSLI